MPSPKLTHSVTSLLSTLLLLNMAGTALAQTKATPPKPAPPQPTAAGSPVPQSPPTANPPSVWTALLSLLKRQEPPLASRSRLCPITPGLLGETYVIWNPRPLFAWQGQVKSLEVRPYSLEHSFDRQPILWQQTLGPEVRQVNYDGPPLQPGQKYDWQIIDAAGIPRRYTFAIMSVSEQQQITHNLKTLLPQLRAANATPTQIATARAQFFAEQQLWSDAVQEMYNYTVQSNISSVGIPANQDIAQYFCTGH